MSFLYALFGGMQNHKIVGIPYDLGFILVAVGLDDCPF